MIRINGMVVALCAFCVPAMACVMGADDGVTGDPNVSTAEAHVTAAPGAPAGPLITLPTRALAKNAVRPRAASTAEEDIVIENFSGQTIFDINTTLQGTVLTFPPVVIGAVSDGEAVVDVPGMSAWSQLITYSNDNVTPFGPTAKTCDWLLLVSFNGSCSATLQGTPLGSGAVACGVDPGSAIDPTTCDLLLGVQFQ